ncbi:hypothetical protein EV1_025353 [Malus domestica]
MDYKSLTLTRLGRDEARVNSLHTKLQLALLQGIKKGILCPCMPRSNPRTSPPLSSPALARAAANTSPGSVSGLQQSHSTHQQRRQLAPMQLLLRLLPAIRPGFQLGWIFHLQPTFGLD